MKKNFIQRIELHCRGWVTLKCIKQWAYTSMLGFVSITEVGAKLGAELEARLGADTPDKSDTGRE